MNTITTDTLDSFTLLQAPPFEGGAGEKATTSANGATTGSTTGGEPAAAPAGGMGIQVLLIGGVVLFLVMTIMGGRKEKKKFDQMISSIKRNDSVRTVGGTIGTVVEVKPDVVIIKIDENSNTKMTVARGKIEAVLTESAAASDSTSTSA